MSIKFGPAGADEGYKGRSADLPAILAAKGLNAYEYQCGRGVNVGMETAQKLGENARASGVVVSLHAPYFISLTNREKTEGNIDYIRQSVQAAAWMGGTRVVVHMGAVMGLERAEAMERTLESMRDVLAAAKAEGWPEEISLCIETMGKGGQLGTLDEVLAVCALSERLRPCVDFGHLYARSLGTFNGGEAYAAALDSMENALGLERARSFHVHFSKIEFSAGGEKKHRTFDDHGQFGPDWTPLARLFKERAYTPVVICESAGTQSADAARMKEIFEGI